MPTRECVDVDDGMLARLVVDDDVDAKQGHAQGLPQRAGQLPDDVIIRRLRHSLDVLSLKKNKKQKMFAHVLETTWGRVRHQAAGEGGAGPTVVKCEDDSGLETL